MRDRRVVAVDRDAGRERRERREAAVGDRQVLDRLGGDRERALAARRLDDRRFALDADVSASAADFDRQRADRTRGRRG